MSTNTSNATSHSLGKSKFGDKKGRLYEVRDVIPIDPIFPPYGEVKFEHQRGDVLSLSDIPEAGELFSIIPRRNLEVTEARLLIEAAYTDHSYVSSAEPVRLDQETTFLIPKSAFGPAGGKLWFIVKGAHDFYEPLNIVA